MIFRNLFIYIFLFIKICIIYAHDVAKNITINAIIFSYYDDPNSYYRVFTNEFNEYSKKNGLGITAEIEILTPEISSSVVENYGTTIDSLLTRRKQKYDIYFYYSAYSKKYGEHLIDLNNYLPKEYITPYDEGLLNQTSYSKDGKLVGLPVNMNLSALFSNMELLAKYNKDPPKTWDELMSTGRYIVEEERKLNNTVLLYNGLINDYSGSMTVYEFINSFRESNESPHPEITSETTVKALEKLKEMKDEIGEDIFTMDDNVSIMTLIAGKEIGANFLFIRYFYMAHIPLFRGTALPGVREGVSGSIAIPNNIAISKYVSDERRDAALEYLKFVVSKDAQREYIIKNSMISAIPELYDEEEVCNIIECDIVKDSYPFSVMSNDENKFCDDSYHVRYRENLFDYIYHNKPVMSVLKAIENITKYFVFSVDTEDSSVGLVIFITFISISMIMVLSLVFAFSKKFENKFLFLSKDLWVITILGSVVLMSSILTLYGHITNTNCHLKVLIVNVGFILSICPSLYKLAINFPQSNRFSMWIENNKYLFVLIVMTTTVVINALLATTSFNFKELVSTDGMHYQKCIMNKKVGNVIYYFTQCYNIIIIMISLLLIFMEWSLEETNLDVKYLATALFMDTLSIIIFNILDKIKFNNYIVYNVLLSINIIVFSLLNYIFIYLVRMIPIFGYNSEYEDNRKLLGKVSTAGITDSKKYSIGASSGNTSSIKNSVYTQNSKSTGGSSSKVNNITKKIMDYHNQTSIS